MKNLPSYQPTGLRTCFFGTPRFAQIVLTKLVDSPYRPTLVITAPDAKVGRGQTRQTSPVKKTASKNNIEVLQPESLRGPNVKGHLSTDNEALSIVQPDLAILVAYGKIIPRDILSIPRYGFINVHPSLLPKYRGPSPIQSAILNGEEKTGITIILLDEKVDHGPLLAQKEVEIEKTDTHESLTEKLAEIGADLLIETLPYYISGDLRPTPQNHKEATFTKHIKKSAGFVNLDNPPTSQTFDRMVRAFYPWPTVWTHLRLSSGGQAKIVKFLPEGKIQPEGKNPMTIKEFLNGYPQTKELIEKLFKQ